MQTEEVSRQACVCRSGSPCLRLGEQWCVPLLTGRHFPRLCLLLLSPRSFLTESGRHFPGLCLLLSLSPRSFLTEPGRHFTRLCLLLPSLRSLLSESGRHFPRLCLLLSLSPRSFLTEPGRHFPRLCLLLLSPHSFLTEPGRHFTHLCLLSLSLHSFLAEPLQLQALHLPFPPPLAPSLSPLGTGRWLPPRQCFGPMLMTSRTPSCEYYCTEPRAPQGWELHLTHLWIS